MTPLHIAAKEGSVELVKLLLAYGADVKAQADRMDRPLAFGNDGENIPLDVLSVLLIPFRPGETPLQLAVRNKHLEVVKLLELKVCTIEELFAAVKAGDVAKIKQFTYFNCHLEAEDEIHFTPLHWAAYEGHFEVMRLLLAANNNVNLETKDGTGNTPLHWAVWKGHLEMVQLLLAKGANLEAKDNIGYTPLQCADIAEIKGQLAMVHLLLERGANVQAISKRGETPSDVWYALGEKFFKTKDYSRAKSCYEQAIKLDKTHVPSLYSVAWINHKGYGVKQNLAEARKYYQRGAELGGYQCKKQLLVLDHPELKTAEDWYALGEKFFRKEKDYPHARASYEYIVEAIDKNHKEALYSLGWIYHQGLGVNQNLDEARKYYQQLEDENGLTALHWAAREGLLEVMELLLEAKNNANLETKDKNGYTPLHWAVRKGHLKIVELLLVKKANREAKNEYEFTPLFLATINKNLEMVKLLLARGANLEAQDQFGYTPLHWAAREGHLEVVKLLLESGANAQASNKKGETPSVMADAKGKEDIANFINGYSEKIKQQQQKGEPHKFQFFAKALRILIRSKVQFPKQVLKKIQVQNNRVRRKIKKHKLKRILVLWFWNNEILQELNSS